jgi:hypothetical protein
MDGRYAQNWITVLGYYWEMYFDLISAEYVLDIDLNVFVLSKNNKFGPTE